MLELVREIRRIKASKASKGTKAEKMAALRLPPFVAAISNYSAPFIIACIWLGSTAATGISAEWIVETLRPEGMQHLVYLIAPLVFVFSFLMIAGFFALLGRMGIIEGKFPRLASHPIYALRRIYGAAWTQVYYFKPLYAIFLGIPFLRTIMFRLFGLRGNLDFLVYPDSWIRDLPLLKIGKGAYLANRCTIGTNLSLTDGSTLVGPITIGDNALIGHLSVFALGCKIGSGAELESATSMGIRITVHPKAKICPKAGIYHGVEIGENTKIGASASIGMRVKIGPNIRIAMGACIPAGSVIQTQADADAYFSSENQKLSAHRDDVLTTLKESLYEAEQWPAQ